MPRVIHHHLMRHLVLTNQENLREEEPLYSPQLYFVQQEISEKRSRFLFSLVSLKGTTLFQAPPSTRGALHHPPHAMYIGMHRRE